MCLKPKLDKSLVTGPYSIAIQEHSGSNFEGFTQLESETNSYRTNKIISRKRK